MGPRKSPGPFPVKLLSALIALCIFSRGAFPASAAEPPPQRPLPIASQRPLEVGGHHLFVDATKGSDTADGSDTAPWKSLRHAFAQIKAGDTLVLRGGVYHGHSTLAIRGTAEKPITLRSHPGEVAILDGGIAEFLNSPATAWEPVQGGAAGEYRSTMVIAKGGDSETADEGEGDGEGGGTAQTNALGNFAANMVPLHGYRFLNDLRSGNDYFTEFKGVNVMEGSGVYCGPGVFFDHATRRIHLRLAHTDQTCIGDGNYQGGTDPRQMPLVISASRQPALTLEDCSHVVLQDIVFRGAVRATLAVRDCENITLDGVTCYGGGAALLVQSTSGLRCVDSAFRGLAAPWTWRWSLKYRAIESRLVSAGGWQPPARRSRDFEFARCEFTDSVDGVFIGGVQDVSIHHCLLDNVSDDGFFVTCGTSPDGTTPGGNVRLTQNYLTGCLTTFAFGVGHGRQKTVGANDAKATGTGVWIARNVLDFRRPVRYQQPPRGETQITTFGRFGGDHGSPAWEPMFIWQNTFLSAEGPYRGAYGLGVAQAMGKGTHRHIANNIFLQFAGVPGEVLPEGKVDLHTDGNIHWATGLTSGAAESFLRRHRSSPRFAESKWAEHDRCADPAFVSASADLQKPLDLRLQPGSAALHGGVAIDPSWPDPLRGKAGDAGAVPHDAEPWRIGIRGRLDAFGNPAATASAALQLTPFLNKATPAGTPPHPRAALVLGYPAFDEKLLKFALEAGHARVDVFDKHWLPVSRFKDYRTVIFAGDLIRAKMNPHAIADEEIPALTEWLRGGGVLVLTRGNARQVFSEAAAVEFIGAPKDREGRTRAPFAPALVLPDHAWVKPLASGTMPAWTEMKNATPIAMSCGENIVGDANGRTILARVPVEKGAILYLGWNVADAMPGGRKASTVEMETAYEAQYGIMQRLLRDALSADIPTPHIAP